MTEYINRDPNDLVSRQEALAALKHKDLVVHQDDDGDDHRFDFVYLDSALDALAALPAIPLDPKVAAFDKLRAVMSPGKYELLAALMDRLDADGYFGSDSSEVQDDLRAAATILDEFLSGALPVLETKKETP